LPYWTAFWLWVFAYMTRTCLLLQG
jgi:hypothetical protein